jgi:capsular exopolysaccharide synthesis family protein
MNPGSSAQEWARPAENPPVVLAAAPTDVARVVPASPPGVPRPGAATTLSAMSILRALRRRSALALGVAILVTGIAGPAAWYWGPAAKYRARAQLQVKAQPPKILFQTVETESLGDYQRYQNTQQTLVKSQWVLNAALRDGQLGTFRLIREQVDPIAWLQSELKVEFIANSEVMEIALSGDNPAELADIVNATERAYMDEVVNRDRKLRIDRHVWLKKLKDTYQANLKERRDMLRKLAEDVGTDDRSTLALQQQYAIEHREYLWGQLRDVQSKKRLLQAALAMRPRPGEADPGDAPPAPSDTEADVDRLIDEEPGVVDLAARLAQAQGGLDAHREYVGRLARRGGDPSMQPLREKVRVAKVQLERRREQLRPLMIRKLQEGGTGERAARGGSFEQELAMYGELERRLNDELKHIALSNKTQTEKTLDMLKLQDEIAQMQGAETKVANEVEALNVELEAPPRVKLIEEAAVPRMRDQKKWLTMFVMIVCGSFFGSLFGIAFLELQSQKVDSADEVPDHLGLQVVGALPILPARARRRGGIARRQEEKDRYWRNLLLESVDATRTMLVHAAHTGSHRVVLITSAVSGEGKTSLASYLATSLARSGLSTLLVDADLRNPALHRLFDLPLAAGLSELLRGEAHLAEVIGVTAVEGLKVVSAGRCDRRTIRALAQGGLGPFLAQLKEQFDFVIVDSSPILPVADALIVAQQVDAVLFSIFRDVSRKTKVFAALQRLQCLGVPVLGAVVTGAHDGLYGSGYYSETTYSTLPDSAADSSGPSS